MVIQVPSWPHLNTATPLTVTLRPSGAWSLPCHTTESWTALQSLWSHWPGVESDTLHVKQPQVMLLVHGCSILLNTALHRNFNKKAVIPVKVPIVISCLKSQIFCNKGFWNDHQVSLSLHVVSLVPGDDLVGIRNRIMGKKISISHLFTLCLTLPL